MAGISGGGPVSAVGGSMAAWVAGGGGQPQPGRETLTVEPLPGWVDDGEVIAGAPPDHQVEGAPLLYL